MEDIGIAAMSAYFKQSSLNTAPIVEVFEPIELSRDELAPVDAVVERRRVVAQLLAPLPSIVAAREVQGVWLGHVCGEVCVRSCPLVA